MIIKVKYNVGDNIKYFDKRSVKVWGPCHCCDGDKYIIGADGEKYSCPSCEGKGQIYEGDTEYQEEKTGTIKTVCVEYNSDVNRENPFIYYFIPQSDHGIMQEDIIEKIK